jgi:hypothetical protein
VVEMGLGPSLPPARACEVGFDVFVEIKCIFSTTPKAKIFSKSSWIETAVNEGHWYYRTLD